VTRLHRGGLAAVLTSWLVAAGCSSAPPPPAPPAGPLQALQPSGPTTWPITFTWTGVAGDGLVRVRVFDDAERQLYGIEARGNKADAPDDLRRSLDPGKSYLWRVARVDENGAEVDQSELKGFSLK
jgi:hypothetical protein